MQKQILSRRDLLKLSLTLPAFAALSKLIPHPDALEKNQGEDLPNIIIIVIDTMSAENLSLYGYPRNTSPNLERFAERATVYHTHQSGGNFTVPGTASLLTGTYPWTHRAINHAGLVARELTERNIFNILPKSYRKLGFSQNLWAMHLLGQFNRDISILLPPTRFTETQHVFGDNFPKDLNPAYLSLDEFMFWHDDPTPSLIFGIPHRALLVHKDTHANLEQSDYPLGIPSTGLLPINFRLDKLYDGIMTTLAELDRETNSPYLAYIHLWGVHEPYKPHIGFDGSFKDSWSPDPKPQHLVGGNRSEEFLQRRRGRYDEYIASQDFEFGRLLDFLESTGILENSYVVLTADHGESFERGTLGHTTPLLFQPLVHVPLVISTPGQRERLDVFSPTNSVDLLPTLAFITHQDVPDWCEGQPLPGMNGLTDAAPRSSFTIEAKGNSAFMPMSRFTMTIRQDNYKLIHYKDGKEYDFYELYDLESDSEELTNLYETLPAVAKPMQEELNTRAALADRKYRN
jgi:arylsulfatase A-like enzyme